MSLLNQSHIRQLLKNRKSARKHRSLPVVKIIITSLNCTFLLSEIVENNQSIAFGICDFAVGHPELAYINLEQLSQFKTSWGRCAERDPILFLQIRYASICKQPLIAVNSPSSNRFWLISRTIKIIKRLVRIEFIGK